MDGPQALEEYKIILKLTAGMFGEIYKRENLVDLLSIYTQKYPKAFGCIFSYFSCCSPGSGSHNALLKRLVKRLQPGVERQEQLFSPPLICGGLWDSAAQVNKSWDGARRLYTLTISSRFLHCRHHGREGNLLLNLPCPCGIGIFHLPSMGQ